MYATRKQSEKSYDTDLFLLDEWDETKFDPIQMYSNESTWMKHPFSSGAIPDNIAEQALSKWEVGTWLVRYDQNDKKQILTIKTEENHYKHVTNLHDYNSLEEALKLNNGRMHIMEHLQKDLRAPPYNKVESTFEDVEIALNEEPIDTWLLWCRPEDQRMIMSKKISEEQIIHNTLSKQFLSVDDIFKHYDLEHQFHPHYDFQLELTLESGKAATYLHNKAKRNIIPSKIIDLTKEAPSDLEQTFECLTLNSRIYLIGHGSRGADHITNDEATTGISAEEFASQLSDLAPELIRETDSTNKLTVSLVACEGGLESNSGKESYGEALSTALDRMNIPAVVLVRKGSVKLKSSGSKLTKMQGSDEWMYQQAGVKVAISTTKGVTTKTIVQY